MNLAELVGRTNVDALDHLERETTIPVVDGLQAQGDLIIIPFSMFAGDPDPNASRWVPAEGIHLVAGGDGRNPHVLVADPGTCTWSAVGNPELGIGIIENTAPAYLLHPEHGGTGIAPGRWVVRRQRERTGLVAD
ncbi:hypothetical protein ACIA8G_02505 [Lentzea sp. NPDC051213]|uniref:hypothetical protein n=1 Tax=Lentzea sp. NPDC051213 TaxID=3364126 RepID=UPI0037B9767E